jgi:hypothetical protein
MPIIDPSMLMMGAGGRDPESMRRAMLVKMLMGNQANKGGGHAGGISQMGNALMLGLLMNGGAGSGGVQMPGLKYGIENIFAGRPWGSPPGGAPT